MDANTKYFDITIDHAARSFSIQYTGFKPSAKDSAIKTLAKIESVAKEGFTYATSRQDEYSELSEERLLEILKQKSSEIHAGYNRKLAKLNWLVRMIFSKEKKVRATLIRIENYLFPSRLLSPLPPELVQQVYKHLSILDTAKLARTTRSEKAHANLVFFNRAKDFGFTGGTCSEAVNYLGYLFKAVVALSKYPVISKEHGIFEKGQLDIEGTLKMLKTVYQTDELDHPQFLEKVFRLFNEKIAFEQFRQQCFREYNEALSLKIKAYIAAVEAYEIAVKKLLSAQALLPNS